MTEAPDTDDVVEDGFLDGRVRLLQPSKGYRAATDAVLLAAAVPAGEGDTVLELGCGAGAAALCLGHRVPGVHLHGLERQARYAELARRNAELNGSRLRVEQGDMRAMPEVLREMVFDAVMLNPPWHGADGSGSPDMSKDVAHRQDASMMVWLSAALSRTRPGGWVVIIQRAEWLAEILGAMAARVGDVAILPLTAREGRPAKRVIVKARKGSRGPLRLAAPLVLHHGAAHVEDGDDYTDAARAILREGAALEF